jgi:hypothetical protein
VPSMAMLQPQQQKRVDGIVALVKEFMDARFSHAVRVNPNIGHVYADLSWQQLVTLKEIIGDTKAWGPIRYYVCDVLCSDDEAKIRSLFTPSDQNSLMNEIVNLAEDKADRRMGNLSIRNMRSLYKTLDPSLERIVELIQTWIWWDLQDVSDMYSFDIEYHRIVKLAKQPLTEKILVYYKKAMKKHGDDEINKKIILEYEVAKLEKIVNRLRGRLEDEPGYHIILKRDDLPSKTLDDIIVTMGKHIRNKQKVEAMGEITDEIRKLYAQTMNMPPQDLTKELILQQEQHSIHQLEESMQSILNLGRPLDEPYNYKMKHFLELEKRFMKLKNAVAPAQPQPEEVAAS